MSPFRPFCPLIRCGPGPPSKIARKAAQSASNALSRPEVSPPPPFAAARPTRILCAFLAMLFSPAAFRLSGEVQIMARIIHYSQ